jgi:hypothetical protein
MDELIRQIYLGAIDDEDMAEIPVNLSANDEYDTAECVADWLDNYLI